MIYLELFLAYIKIGLFSIGGGHASIPVVQSVIVDGKGWLTIDEFTAMITISEMTPGPFGINSATYVGVKIAGILGGIISTLSFLLPSIFICIGLYLIVKRFRKLRAIDGLMLGIKPAVSGLISSAGLSITLLAILGGSTLSTLKLGISCDAIAIGIAVCAFFITRKTKLNPIIVILLSGVVGLILYTLF